MICHLIVCSVLGNTSSQKLLHNRRAVLLAMCSYLGPLTSWFNYVNRAYHRGAQFCQMLANPVISGLIRKQNRSNLKSCFPPKKNHLTKSVMWWLSAAGATTYVEWEFHRCLKRGNWQIILASLACSLSTDTSSSKMASHQIYFRTFFFLLDSL